MPVSRHLYGRLTTGNPLRDEHLGTRGEPLAKPASGHAVTTTLTYDGDVAEAAAAAAVAQAATVDHRLRALDDEPLWQGRLLGDFAVGEVLGRGGCGTVYRAEQRSLGRPAVVKVVHRALIARGDAADRFLREARLASRFDHPYAAHVYSFGVEPDSVMWIAMELVDGTPLGQLVKRSGPLPLEQFVPLFERLCEVVQSAHDQGIVHRDIKPSNVMVISRAGRLMPKLLDFGIAKMVAAGEAQPAAAAADPAGDTGDTGDTADGNNGDRAATIAIATGSSPAVQTLTHQGQILGSPSYMAPEQWRDSASAGPLADQYALALLAFEVLTGTHAFAGPSLEALAYQHDHAPLPALPASLPSALHAVLARASDKQPEQRYANLTELANAIRVSALGAGGELPAAPAELPDEASPYPGLAAYGAADSESFVGRDHDIEALIDQLERHPIVTVVGPSGSGKTSFLAAGLVPCLEPRWHAELIRPGGDPPAVLSAIAARAGGDAHPYRDPARRDVPLSPPEIAAGLVRLAETRDVTLAVIVDQAEELFTMCGDDARRAEFAEALVLASASPRVRVALALRDDFLCRIEQLSAWRGMLGRAIHVLGIPRRDDLERMLVVPARRRGFGFDDPALPREIVDQVADRPGALPLIAFTAAQLWEHRDRRFRRLTRSAYARIGGVTGALVQHADAVVDRMSVPDRRQVRLVFRRLITAEGARALISRRDLESSLGEPSAAGVVDRLLAARLIVSRDDDAGDRIEIIHESLATTWPRLAAWRREDADGTRLQDQLAVAARHWNDRARPGDLLWRGEALADLRRWQDRGDHSLTPVEQAFARASFASAARARRARIAVVGGAFAVLVAGIVGLVSANRKIADQRAAAVERLTATLEERGRVAIADGDDARAMLYLAEARGLGARGPAFDLLAARALPSLDAGLEIIGHGKTGIWGLEVGAGALITLGSDFALSRWDDAGHQTHLGDGIYYTALVGDVAISVASHGDIVALDRDGRVRWRAEHAVADLPLRAGIVASPAAHLIAAFGHAATLRDLETGAPRGELPHDKDVSAIAIDGDGSHVATGDLAGVVRIWDTRTAALVATCEPHTGIVRALEFAPDRRSVVSGGNDADVRICDAATGATLHRLVGHSHQVVSVDVSSDGKSIVSAGRDGKPRIWDARTGLLLRVLDGHRGTVISAQFSPDDRRILSFGVDGTARIWDRDGTALGSLQGHGGRIFAGRWDRDGRRVITTSADGAIRRWDPDRAIKTARTQAHTGAISDLQLSRDGRWVVTAGADRRAIVWDRATLAPVVVLDHDAGVRSIALAPDGAGAVTADDAGHASIWQLPAGTRVARLGTQITAAAYAPDGSVITAGDGAVKFWTAAGAELAAVPLDYAAERLVLDPSGRWLFVRGATPSVVVVDVAARALRTRLAVDDRQVRSIAADATRVAISDGSTVRLWQLDSFAALPTLARARSPIVGVWLSSNGRVISASADATQVWDAAGKIAANLAGTNVVFALATSPDGALFATTGTDGSLEIWDAVAYRQLVQLPAHRLPAFTLQLTRDGTSAITGGNDGSLVIWDLARRPRTAAELAAIVRCRVPLRLDGDVALPRELDFDDPACRALVVDR